MIMIRRRFFVLLALALTACCSFVLLKKKKPVLYIIGDSTVRNGDGTGKGQQWGWGSFMASGFDTTKIGVQNHAIGGRSSRTFITEGRWDKILQTLGKGDYVIMQFGHNDASPLDDTARARGTIRGVGEDSTEIWNPIRKMKEVVHTYGWYMRKYVRETRARGATAIICSLVPRNNWKDGKVFRSGDSWALWAKQVAEQEGAYFIDLNELVAAKYDALGETAVKKFFPADNTHTNEEGARLNMVTVVEMIRKIKPGSLAKYLK
jgi:lysophospholipase L1-like esterase